MRSPSLSAILEPKIAGENQLETDEDIVRHIKEKTTTMRHPVGSCRMGGDDRAVVDAHLRVKGIEGFRIIDASIMPNIVSGNTNAPTMMNFWTVLVSALGPARIRLCSAAGSVRPK